MALDHEQAAGVPSFDETAGVAAQGATSAPEPTREDQQLPAATQIPSNKNIAVRQSATACTCRSQLNRDPAIAKPHNIEYHDDVFYCAECHYGYDLTLAKQVSTLAPQYAVAYAEILRAEPSALRRRAAPQLWTPLEYACHTRDVLLVQRERLLAARRSDAPVTEPMGRDERVEHDGYLQQQPADVARQLQDATLLFTHALDQLGPEDWERTLTVPYPETVERSLRWLAIHTVHEMRHHLLDIRRQLEHP